MLCAALARGACSSPLSISPPPLLMLSSPAGARGCGEMGARGQWPPGPHSQLEAPGLHYYNHYTRAAPAPTVSILLPCLSLILAAVGSSLRTDSGKTELEVTSRTRARRTHGWSSCIQRRAVRSPPSLANGKESDDEDDNNSKHSRGACVIGLVSPQHLGSWSRCFGE